MTHFWDNLLNLKNRLSLYPKTHNKYMPQVRLRSLSYLRILCPIVEPKILCLREVKVTMYYKSLLSYSFFALFTIYDNNINNLVFPLVLVLHTYISYSIPDRWLWSWVLTLSAAPCVRLRMVQGTKELSSDPVHSPVIIGGPNILNINQRLTKYFKYCVEHLYTVTLR